MFSLIRSRLVFKSIFVILCIAPFLAGTTVIKNPGASDLVHSQTVNAILGDESYVETYGEAPDEKVSEKKRIVTHLSYVKNILQASNTAHLNEAQKKNRLSNLKYLEEYIQRGEFPKNEAYPGQRRPNFIDSEGNICAVGYLVEQTVGREVAESIKEKYQYEYVMNMGSEVLSSWAKTNGFSLKELAMIQPSYGCCNVGPGNNSDNKINETAEIFIIGTNIGFAVFNGYSAGQNSTKLIPALAGVALASSSITLSFTSHANYSSADFISGTVSLAASGWAFYSLFSNKTPKSNLAIAPIPNSEFKGGVGLGINYRF